MVTRPVITSMANAIRLHWRRVVAVTWGWRQCKSATISTIGGSVVVVCELSSCARQLYTTRGHLTSFLAKVLLIRHYSECFPTPRSSRSDTDKLRKATSHI